MDQISTSLSNPSGSSALVAAITWLQATLLGTVAKTIAVIAVGCLGMLLLSGRVPYRRGMTVLAGCFILFGSARIATGLQSVITSSDRFSGSVVVASPPVWVPPTPPPPVPANYDPYAGASVPQR
ncbi:MAG: TrbC/VirB2 family protein [Pseudomonadota bacterium]|uniref:TrbC/VirB2 family protein n=1 Tax=unclassified Sphingomonas TaxID=196159 RepID=UPI000A592488|nr:MULTISPECIES: TrbC/VirB2 family protein [unclassified Sphingomonas]